MDEGEKFFVYILRTNKNTLYTGLTNDIERRLEKHRKGKGAKYLRGFSAITLVYLEECGNKSAALKREAEIKRLSKIDKEKLVAENENTCQTLAV